jgi:hypothetical protein
VILGCDWMEHSTWMNSNRVILLLIAAYLVLATAFNITNGIGEAPDEPPHVDYVRYMVEHHALPVQTRDAAQRISNEAHQPPAYYALGALLTGWINTDGEQLEPNPSFDITPGRVWGRQNFYHPPSQAFPYHGLALAYHWLRGLSTVLGAITIWAMYQAARTAAPRQPAVALLAAGLAAFNPQFLFITASVSNDNMAMVAVSLMLLTGLAAWKQTSLRFTLLMGLLIGLSALSKYTSLAAAPGAILMLAAPYIRKRQWHALIRHLTIMGTLALLMAGWWYGRNWQLYGDPLAQRMALHVLASVRRYSPWQLAELPLNVYNTFTSYWGRFGWTQITLHPAIYVALAVLCIAALAGILRATWHGARASGWKRWDAIPWFGLALSGAGVLGSIILYHLSIPADQGRLLFPGIVPYAIFMALGLVELAGQCKTTLAIGVIAGLIALSIGSIVFVLIPSFELPQMLSEVDLRVTHPLTAQFGNGIALRGFDVSPRALRPGQSFDLTLYWRALRPVETNYWLLIQLLDPSGRPIAHSTTLPYLGRYATVLWRPGDLFADRYRLRVVQDATAGAAELSVLFDAREPSPEAQWALDGQPVGERLSLTTLKIVPPSQPVYHPTYPMSIRFGNAAHLAGYDLLTPSIRAGQSLTVTLYWQVLQPSQPDVHVFLHLICADGQLVAQDDSVPGNGRYPSTLWSAGDSIRDEHTLELPPDVQAQACTLSTGLYDFDAGNRLPAVDAKGQRLAADRAILTNLDLVSQ